MANNHVYITVINIKVNVLQSIGNNQNPTQKIFFIS